MAITYFGGANSSGTGTGTSVSITPPGSMASDDFVIVSVQYRANTDITISVNNDGGQTWTKLTSSDRTSVFVNSDTFHCKFNGTWSADPSFSIPAGTDGMIARMDVFRGVDTTSPIDVASSEQNAGTPGGPPYLCTLTGITTLTNGAFAYCYIATGDNCTIVVNTSGWSYNNATTSGGSDAAICTAYKEFPTAGGTGNVEFEETSLGPDGWAGRILAIKPATGGGGGGGGDVGLFTLQSMGRGVGVHANARLGGVLDY